jgi:hypothetical protein
MAVRINATRVGRAVFLEGRAAFRGDEHPRRGARSRTLFDRAHRSKFNTLNTRIQKDEMPMFSV